MKNNILAMIVTSFILSGCANPLLHTIDNSNETFEKQQSPYRYIEIEKQDTHTTFQLEAAGTPHQTISMLSDLLLVDILKGIKDNCGFKKEDIVETRKVSYEPPQFYGVWVFKDKRSERPDKTSAISVVLNQVPNGGGVDIYLVGNCHATPKQITFSN